MLIRDFPGAQSAAFNSYQKYEQLQKYGIGQKLALAIF
jgi:hypothetical protein